MRVVIFGIIITTLSRLWLVEAFGALGEIFLNVVDFVETLLRAFLDNSELVAHFLIQAFLYVSYG